MDNQKTSIEDLIKLEEQVNAISAQMRKQGEEKNKIESELKRLETEYQTRVREAVSAYDSAIDEVERKRVKEIEGLAKKRDALMSLIVEQLATQGIRFSDIMAIDSKGRLIEKYASLEVAREPFKNKEGNVLTFNPYNAIVYAEDHGMWLPSAALTCNYIVAAHNSKEPDAVALKMQYKDNGNGNGWHVQNTVIDWKGRQVIHYPSREDFVRAGYSAQKEVNVGRVGKPIDFSPEDLSDKELAEALGNKKYRAFMQDVTGLEKPEILVEVAQSLGRVAKAWVPNNPRKADYVAGVFVGSLGYSFVISTYYDLDNYFAGRGVR